jgi:chromosome segregation ATPase
MDAMPQSWADNRFNEFRAEMARRFDQLDRRMDERFERMDERFERMDERFERTDERFDRMDERFDQVDRRLDQVDRRLDQVDKRFEQVDIEMRHQRGELGSINRTLAQAAIGMSAAYLAGFGALIAFIATQI